MSLDASEELLNAFVDGQLGHRESAQLLSEIGRDAALRSALSELQGVKAQVRQCYARVPAAPRRPIAPRRTTRFGAALALAGLVALALAVGWFGRGLSSLLP